MSTDRILEGMVEVIGTGSGVCSPTVSKMS